MTQMSAIKSLKKTGICAKSDNMRAVLVQIILSYLKAPEFVPSWERTGYQYYEESREVRSVDCQSEEAEVQYQFPPGCYQPLHLPPWQPYSWNRGHKW